jgi:hypothetical protein
LTPAEDAIADRDILLTQIGLLCNGRTDFNDVDLFEMMSCSSTPSTSKRSPLNLFSGSGSMIFPQLAHTQHCAT